MRRQEADGKEECYGGPLGAEVGTLTSARKWSVKHTSRLPGDFSVILLVACLSFSYFKIMFFKHFNIDSVLLSLFFFFGFILI